MKYDFRKIEKKWQKYWFDNQTYAVYEDQKKPKFYVLDMFPYPSGAGLHVGHPLGYIASDVYARYKRLKGYNVLHPMGYDSFGLPTEQYAIETGIHPELATKNNISRYRKQLDRLGFSYDWSREIRTSDKNYYKWTQWIFKQFYNSYYCLKSNKAKDIQVLKEKFSKKGSYSCNAYCGEDELIFSSEEWNSFTYEKQENILGNFRLAYLSETLVNWCEGLGTVLANDEVKDGYSERGSFPVEQKLMKQWSLRITAYAERLLEGLDGIEWSESIKEVQRNWIGRSNGVSLNFSIEQHDETIEVFTTRPDTLYGVSFIVLAPEHELVRKITTSQQKNKVEDYIKNVKLKSDVDRQSSQNITGVFTGSYVQHPFTFEKLQVWIADYVLASYGTGAIMAVPCGDQRDWNFANHFNIEFKNIFKDINVSKKAYEEKNGIITNSEFLNDLEINKAINCAIEKIENKALGKKKINFRLRDAVFSRQRYWGEPFPIYYKDDTPMVLKADEYLTLPNIDKYLPTSTGQPPLARAKKEDWNIFDGDRMETNVMPGWAGSSWYFLRYMDPKNNVDFCSKEKSDYWGQVDLYIGGAEHAVGHLLYSRFWTKFLYDKKLISFDEPFKKLINQGMILGRSNFVYRIVDSNKFVTYEEKFKYSTIPIHVDISLVDNDILNIEKFREWRKEYNTAEFVLNEDEKYVCGSEIEKMSKSKYNVQTPDQLVDKFGADTLRLYEMFLGPLEQFKPWDTKGINGVHNFLRKFWRLIHDSENNFSISQEPVNRNNLKTIHKTIKKVEEDISRYSFNTVVSTLMICINELTDQNCNNKEIISDFTILLSPYAPHIAEEIWSKLGNSESIVNAIFPKYKEEFLEEKIINYPISFNGKMRYKIPLDVDISKEEIEKQVMEHEKTAYYLSGKLPKKVIIVPKKIVNIVF
tara:strand:+ start:2533 stop:5301 length:2769 start_codon:yes stop_codon:yes gene_type:complete